MNRVLLPLLLGSLLLGCQREAPVYEDQFVAMGTIYQLSLYGVDQARGAQISQQVQDDLRFMEYAWHAWRPGPLGRVNQLLRSGEEFSINPSILPLVIQSKQLYTSSQGLFNPALGELIAMWGFHNDDPSHSTPPDPALVQEYMRDPPSMDDIEISGIRARGHNPHIKLDFGAFAKGYGIQQILARLKSEGIDNAILNAGGDLQAIGRHGNRPWSVAIRNPFQPGVIGSVEVADGEGVFTSGNYERYYLQGQKRYSHIIDPRNGQPTTITASATVIHPDAAVADAAATAMLIAGPEGWWQVARSMGIHYVLLIDEKGVLYMNPEMAARLKLETGATLQTRISAPLEP